jgi:hypothetical protein
VRAAIARRCSTTIVASPCFMAGCSCYTIIGKFLFHVFAIISASCGASGSGVWGMVVVVWVSSGGFPPKRPCSRSSAVVGGGSGGECRQFADEGLQLKPKVSLR